SSELRMINGIIEGNQCKRMILSRTRKVKILNNVIKESFSMQEQEGAYFKGNDLTLNHNFDPNVIESFVNNKIVFTDGHKITGSISYLKNFTNNNIESMYLPIDEFIFSPSYNSG